MQVIFFSKLYVHGALTEIEDLRMVHYFGTLNQKRKHFELATLDFMDIDCSTRNRCYRY